VIDEDDPMIIRAAALTTRDVVGGLFVAIAAAGAVEALAFVPILPRRILAVGLTVAVFAQALNLWSRDITRLMGRTGTTVITRGGTWLLAVLFTMIAFVLGLTEPFLVGRAASRGMQIHELYLLLFVTATLMFAAAGTFTLGRGLRGAAFGARLGAASGIVAAAAFFVVAITLDTLGWRVGAPGASKRATMVVVTLTGLLVAAIASGAVVGIMLRRSQREKPVQ
jgi:hypothetical protein